MNREILFRGKRKSQDKDFDGEWVYGDLLHNLVYDGRENEVRIGDVYFDKDTNDEIHGTGCVLVYPETVGQFTGLTDKNGKKIFEGDIVSPNRLCGIYVVKFNNEQCRFSIYINGAYEQAGFNQDTMLNYEIIGNIHDNPELLTDKT